MWYKVKDQKTKKTKQEVYKGVVVSVDGENGEIRVRFVVDGTEETIDVSSIANVLESPSPPRRAGAGGQKRKRT